MDVERGALHLVRRSDDGGLGAEVGPGRIRFDSSSPRSTSAPSTCMLAMRSGTMTGRFEAASSPYRAMAIGFMIRVSVDLTLDPQCKQKSPEKR